MKPCEGERCDLARAGRQWAAGGPDDILNDLPGEEEGKNDK
eukprot:CAMPEP_0117691422 /NCGR_PEP_ID=MMETSP0804-20121206/25714_1 /TAXON_ID=1074897 /ORGANISM="Tetraselmis astigmatica, Strain CCMP880" /LENGTH=40 /DNA_ID= /DNA_START= /DNA_END= /DNA_ORIENTATION=